tara:strand:- start:263 stop:1039 length:777 start_codon:yes stop_codon:yes gene_type:complete
MKNEISVIIPTIGGRESIINAVESVINQKNVYTEIIIVFDNKPIDFELKKNFKDIILIQNIGNKGGNACRNLGASFAKYKFIAFLDDDDTWRDDKLIKQVKLILKSSTNTLIYTGKNIITKSNNKTKIRYNYSKQTNASSLISLSKINFIGSTSSILLRKSTFDKVRGFKEDLSALQDYELYIRLAYNDVFFVGIDEPLLNYYITQNKSSVSMKFKKNYKSSLELLKLFKTIKTRSNFILNIVLLYNLKVLFHRLRFI